MPHTDPSHPDHPAYLEALAQLREDLRQADREAAGYLMHQCIEDNLNDAGVLSLAKGEHLAGFQPGPDGLLHPLVGKPAAE